LDVAFATDAGADKAIVFEYVQRAKLKRYSIGLNAVNILTYDDLLARAKDFYRNNHRSISETEDSD
jgi:hypothetical protein